LKIVKSDLNIRKLKIQNDLDVWHLQQIVEQKDLVKARTVRTIFIRREDQKEKGRRKLVLLKIRVEKIEFDEYQKKLRLNGKIVEGPEEIQLGDYHTIEVGRGDVIEIEKERWNEEQLERLKRASIRIEVLRDPKVLEEFFVHCNKNDGLVVYGFDQVKVAAGFGAVKIVLIPEEKLRDKTFEDLMKLIESKRGEIKLVSKKDVTGKKFCNTFDVGAILRFPIS